MSPNIDLTAKTAGISQNPHRKKAVTSALRKPKSAARPQGVAIKQSPVLASPEKKDAVLAETMRRHHLTLEEDGALEAAEAKMEQLERAKEEVRMLAAKVAADEQLVAAVASAGASPT